MLTVNVTGYFLAWANSVNPLGVGPEFLVATDGLYGDGNGPLHRYSPNTSPSNIYGWPCLIGKRRIIAPMGQSNWRWNTQNNNT